MSQLVFQSISGGTTTLNGTNTAGTYNLTVPAADGTLLYEDLTGNITFTNVTVTGQLSLTGTGAFKIPVGNTIQRPTPAAGQIRYNTDGGGLYEGYLPAVSAWYKFSMVPEGQYTITYLAVAGGGGGNSQFAGGGGAGGLQAGSFTALPTTLYTITIGAGGSVAGNGVNSSITSVVTVTGGGAGGTGDNPGSAGSVGGSGGGGGAGAPQYAGGNGITSQGYAGGSGNFGSAGAGGGAGYYGTNGGGYGAVGGTGGVGIQSSITGVSIYYAGGGGGGSAQSSGGSGGAGGGGAGGPSTGGVGGNGGVNLGGGGGGGGGGYSAGGNGGSGVVILSIPTANYTGTVTGTPTVTTSGSNTIVKYTSSGTYTS